LEEILEVPVFLRNDTAIVGLGEAHAGAGKGHEIVVYITVSTGVGGVRIIKGEIAKNQFGFEIGHQIIDLDGSVCPSCEKPVDLENMISGRATEQRLKIKPETNSAIILKIRHDSTGRFSSNNSLLIRRLALFLTEPPSFMRYII